MIYFYRLILLLPFLLSRGVFFLSSCFCIDWLFFVFFLLLSLLSRFEIIPIISVFLLGGFFFFSEHSRCSSLVSWLPFLHLRSQPEVHSLLFWSYAVFSLWQLSISLCFSVLEFHCGVSDCGSSPFLAWECLGFLNLESYYYFFLISCGRVSALFLQILPLSHSFSSLLVGSS